MNVVNLVFTFNPLLKELAEHLNKTKWKSLKIIEHTDNQGSAKDNGDLSLQRAIAIKNYLLKKGISKGEFNCIGLGETQPLLSNDTAEGRETNRRVEIRIIE